MCKAEPIGGPYIAIVILMALACLHLTALPTAASSSEEERESLRGLPGVRVVIEHLHAEAKADGLSEDSIRSAVELILRSSGIRILDGGGLPYLYVEVLTIKSRAGFHAFVIQVELKQLVSLVDQPEWSGHAATWEQIVVGHVGTHDIRKIISYIEPMVKEFANDFLARQSK